MTELYKVNSIYKVNNLIEDNEIDNIIDSKTEFGKSRPDTSTNATDASKFLKERIEKEQNGLK